MTNEPVAEGWGGGFGINGRNVVLETKGEFFAWTEKGGRGFLGSIYSILSQIGGSCVPQGLASRSVEEAERKKFEAIFVCMHAETVWIR